ncbi:MAG: type IV secretory system conjugative DNA transfer family protein [Candidatus Competibacter sp.]|nr:type IV secretory system conjugative DNA transfer family protein [Candidatus Competibacter sp.]
MPSIWLGERWNPKDRAKGTPLYGDAVLYAGERHLTMFGPNGSGKGATIEIPNLLHLGNDVSIVSIDPKGQNAAVTAAWRRRVGEVWVLNPFGLHVALYPDLASVGFNPLAALDPSSDRFFDKARALAEALIRVEGDSQPFFPQSAQGLLTGLMMWEVIQARQAGRAPSLAHVRDLLMGADAASMPDDDDLTGLQITAARMEDSGHSSVAGLGRMFARDSKEIASVVSTAIAQTHWLESVPMRRDLEKNGVRFRQLKEKPTTVYVILPASDLDDFSVWLRLVITTALGELYGQSGAGLRTLFMLSEFAALGKLKPITTALGQARGYGIQLFPVLQDLNQLRGIYGKDFSHTFLGMSGATIAFTPNDFETAEWMSRRSTEHYVAGPTFSDDPRGAGGARESWALQRRRLYPADDLFDLPEFHALTWFAGQGPPTPVRTRRYWELPFCKGRYRPDPFHPNGTPGASRGVG